MRALVPTLAVLGIALSAPANGEVVETSPTGFSTRDTIVVAAAPDDVWIELTDPAKWWNPEHSWSGDSANLTLYPEAGGCFCEALPKSGGSVEHARVIRSEPGELLRMRGAFGPLQSEALTGTLLITLEPVAGGTRINWDYVVGGHARFDFAAIAPAVDGVMSEQLGRLADRLGRFKGGAN